MLSSFCSTKLKCMFWLSRSSLLIINSTEDSYDKNKTKKLQMFKVSGLNLTHLEKEYEFSAFSTPLQPCNDANMK